MEKNELYHYGVLGMKWGRRLYQNKDGTLTARGKKRYNKDLAKLKAKEKIIKNKQQTQAKIDKLAALDKSIKEAQQNLRNGNKPTKKAGVEEETSLSPDAKKIYENRHRMTDKQIQDAYNRLNNERNIKNMIPERKSAGKKFIDAFIKSSKTTKDVVDASDDFYKSVKKGAELIDKLTKSKAK